MLFVLCGFSYIVLFVFAKMMNYLKIEICFSDIYIYIYIRERIDFYFIPLREKHKNQLRYHPNLLHKKLRFTL